jgi:hypothetical protein
MTHKVMDLFSTFSDKSGKMQDFAQRLSVAFLSTVILNLLFSIVLLYFIPLTVLLNKVEPPFNVP